MVTLGRSNPQHLRFTEDDTKLFVGDAVGRIYCWQCTEPGRMSDHWVKDSGAKVSQTTGSKIAGLR